MPFDYLISAFVTLLVVVDPITNFLKAGREIEAEAMLMRLVDHLKAEQITGVFTSLTHGGSFLEQTEVGISSLIDVWMMLRDIELGGERNRGMYVLKSRGMAHSNQIREFTSPITASSSRTLMWGRVGC
jgi:circadian clock protein KaiC